MDTNSMVKSLTAKFPKADVKTNLAKNSISIYMDGHFYSISHDNQTYHIVVSRKDSKQIRKGFDTLKEALASLMIFIDR